MSQVCFNSRYFVVNPTAAQVHHSCMSLKLARLPDQISSQPAHRLRHDTRQRYNLQVAIDPKLDQTKRRPSKLCRIPSLVHKLHVTASITSVQRIIVRCADNGRLCVLMQTSLCPLMPQAGRRRHSAITPTASIESVSTGIPESITAATIESISPVNVESTSVPSGEGVSEAKSKFNIVFVASEVAPFSKTGASDLHGLYAILHTGLLRRLRSVVVDEHAA